MLWYSGTTNEGTNCSQNTGERHRGGTEIRASQRCGWQRQREPVHGLLPAGGISPQ